MSSGEEPLAATARGPVSGSGSATIEPSIDSGAGSPAPRPSAAATASRASSISAWLRAITAGQPPSSSPPT